MTVRIDGALKVSGSAKYTSDYNFPGMLYAVPVCASITHGVIKSLDTREAQTMPGVKAIYHRENIGKLFRATSGGMLFNIHDEHRPLFEDDIISYYGQYVAAAVALTYEQAMAAAAAVKVSYEIYEHNVSSNLSSNEITAQPVIDIEQGDAEAAYAQALIKIDESYYTPVETHNPIELHASVATFDGQNFTLYETTQGVVNHRDVLAQMLGVLPENIRIISRFLGSGFGGKLWPWMHSLIAASAARNLGCPVKLVVSRPMMFQNVGHRPRILQRIRLGAMPDGKLVALMQESLNHTSMLDDYFENCSEATGYTYSAPNIRATSAIIRRHVGPPTSMRGPGAVPGIYALESAIDELALKLAIDPLELRLINEAQKDVGLNLPFSSRHLIECYKIGAKKFGWERRNPKIASMRQENLILGWGMAGASWLAERLPAEVTFDLRDDGSVRIATAVQDIGGGTYTVLAQIVSEKLGIPYSRIEVVLGDTILAAGPVSGGSWTTASIIPAALKAIDNALKNLFTTANKLIAGQKLENFSFAHGCLHLQDGSLGAGLKFEEVLKQSNIRLMLGKATSKGTFGGPKKDFSTHSFGAHFVEVSWQPEIARLRVSRVVSVMDAGKIINPLPARNQIEGAIVMGIGMALLEETMYDPAVGNPLNNNLADYMVMTNADSPKIDVTFIEYPDLVLNELGARGLGELGMAGVAPAITAAVYHATGVRVRNLPIRIEDLLMSQVAY
jgi:xanthine dehydrogenase YagR molybdenum-binding subunit